MNKYILSFLFILNVVFLSGQNYQNLCSPGSTYFTGSAESLNEYHYDSVVVQGQDSIFYSFYTIHKPYTCATTDLGPLLCRVVRKRSDGWFVFLDRNTDSIKFNTQAGLNQSFICRTINGNCTVEGKVISIRQDTVIDTVDQVKEIMFTVKNPDGTVFPHVINGTTVILSQHFGFSKTIDFNRFPNDTISYVLIGKGAPSRGLQVFGWKDVYNFEINDEFHYKGCLFGTNGGPYYESITKILDKTIYGNIDSVKYIMEICRDVFYPGNYDSHDTTTVTYDFLALSLNPIISYAPFEYIPDMDYDYAAEIKLTTNYNSRPVKWYWDHAYQSYGNPICWSDPFEGEHHSYEFAPGLGRTSYFHILRDYVITWEQDYLVYFKKGNTTWGTPNALDCNLLLPINDKKAGYNILVNFIPNPVTQFSTIRISGTDKKSMLTITLYDGLGRNVMTIPVEGKTTPFNRHGLPSGLYLYFLTSDEGILLSIGKIILE